MKKNILLILLIAISLSAWSQTVSKLLASRHDKYNQPSSNWAFSDSDLYFYNGHALDTAIHVFYYSQNTWKLYYKAILDYNSSNQLNELYYQKRDTVTGQYTNFSYRFSFGYNAVGDTISELFQRWDSATRNWLNIERFLKYPDAFHHDTALIIQRWSTGWDNNIYSQIQRDASGRITIETDYQWATNAYMPQSKFFFTYNSSNQLTKFLHQGWNTTTSAWQNDNQFLYTWNSSGDNSQRQHQVWSTMPIGWNNDSVVYQSFNGTHKIVNQIAEIYNTSTSAYDNREQDIYTYDVNDNMLTHEYEQWHNNQWQKQTHETDQYDANNNRIYQLNENYDNMVSLYTPYDRTYYYYTQLSTGIAESLSYSNLQLYPNPIHGEEIHIRFDNTDDGSVTLCIYDLQGRMISTENQNISTSISDLTLDISSLTPGAYIITISNASHTRTSSMKMIKE